MMSFFGPMAWLCSVVESPATQEPSPSKTNVFTVLRLMFCVSHFLLFGLGSGEIFPV